MLIHLELHTRNYYSFRPGANYHAYDDQPNQGKKKMATQPSQWFVQMMTIERAAESYDGLLFRLI
jgi:hypothetical protein